MVIFGVSLQMDLLQQRTHAKNINNDEYNKLNIGHVAT